MKVLDLFCCEGGASTGYHRAGFEVYGVDRFRYRDEDGTLKGHSRKRYPFAAHQGDALEVLLALLRGEAVCFTHVDGREEWLRLGDFVAIVASPPCQAYSITKHSHNNDHPELVEPVRELLRQTGLPYIIENVPGAPLINPITLCGASFGLTAVDLDGAHLVLKRHRLFESNIFLAPVECECLIYKDRGYQVGGVYGGGSADRRHARDVRRGGYTPSKGVMAALIGVDWMTGDGLSQSIPPAYTTYLGEQLLAALEVVSAS